jgi:cysteinyl-tRNA synthetase
VNRSGRQIGSVSDLALEKAMALEIYDTATRTRRVFTPIDPKNVRMYVCGSTVYDLAHIGNARPVIVFDVLYRLLRHTYGEKHVSYVRNITDIDDKINKRANERGITIRELTEKTAAIYTQDMQGLGNLAPTSEPRATETIPEIITMISKLIDKGFAYVAEGHVLFNVPAMPDYGKFSGRATDELIAGARVDVAPYKKSPMDFVLWKPSDDPSLPGWDSPWGRGRPGWHIECSAMSEKLLGETFDIHGGGSDLIFPHHENEVAQSVCAHDGKTLANFWMHNAMLELSGEKMAKSIGNVMTAHGLLELWPGEVLRLQMLMTHYRHPLEWTEDQSREAKKILDRWYAVVANVADRDVGPMPPEIQAALEDDLNTPAVITELHRLASEAAKGSNSAAIKLKSAGRALGFFGVSLEAWSKWRPKNFAVDETKVLALIEARNAARKAKNFAEADRIRAELTQLGIAIEDTPSGTKWKVDV